MTLRLVVAPGEPLLSTICSAETRRRLEERFEVVWNDEGRNLTPDELGDRLVGASVLVTSWRTPRLTPGMLAAAPTLKAICHAAGTIKSIVPAEAFDRGIAVFSSNLRLAQSVGEYCLAAILTMQRRLPTLDAHMREGLWKSPSTRGRELFGARVGLVGSGATARALLPLLAPFGADVVVHDPYLSSESAASLGVRLVTLAEAMSCEIVSLHAPVTPETTGMITRELLARLPDDALLINAARSAVLDTAALESELRSGRIRAVLDVFDVEPPTLAPWLREAPNVLLTPHVAGNTVQGHEQLVGLAVDDAVEWLESGVKGPTYVDPAVLARSA